MKSAYDIINVRLLVSLISLLIVCVLGANIIITMNTTETIIIEQNKDVLRLLSNNVIQNLISSFIVPSMRSFGRLSLVIPEQYNMLSSVVEKALQQFPMAECSIFSLDGRLIYTSGMQVNSISTALVKHIAQTQQGVVYTQFPTLMEMLFSTTSQATMRSYYPIVINEQSISFIPTIVKSQERVLGIVEIYLDCTDALQSLQEKYRIFSITICILILCASIATMTIIRRANIIANAKVLTLEKMKKELADKEHLASIGRLVASLAHEIRNPLGIIYSSVQMSLKYENDMPQRLVVLLEKMKDEVMDLRALVNTFLDYAKPAVKKNDAIALLPLVQTVCTALQEKIDIHRITITMDVPDNVIMHISKDSIYRALLNIVENALDAPHVRHINIYMKENEGYWSLCIEDDGIGFEGDLEIYVEPFYTTKEEGIGLGLSIVKKNMEIYDVRLELSNTAQGARICLYIPQERVTRIH